MRGLFSAVQRRMISFHSVQPIYNEATMKHSTAALLKNVKPDRSNLVTDRILEGLNGNAQVTIENLVTRDSKHIKLWVISPEFENVEMWSRHTHIQGLIKDLIGKENGIVSVKHLACHTPAEAKNEFKEQYVTSEKQ